MPGGLEDLPGFLCCWEERTPPNSAANRTGGWILALPPPFLLPPRRLETWMAPFSAHGKGRVHGLALSGVLGLGEEPGASKCNLGSVETSVGQ